jgi:hypothetical protein
MPDTMGTLSSIEEPAFCPREPRRSKGVIPTRWLGAEKRRKVIFVLSLSYVVHETRLVESFRLRPRDSKTVNHSGRDSRFRELT